MFFNFMVLGVLVGLLLNFGIMIVMVLFKVLVLVCVMGFFVNLFI